MKLNHYTYFFSFLFLALSFQSLNAQLVANGDFETWNAGVPDGWTTIETDIAVAEENTIVYSGAASASINVLSGTQGNTDFRQSIPLVEGTVYKVTTWVYHTEGGVAARIYADGFENYSDETTVGAWQELTTTFTAGSTGDLEVGLRFYDQAGFDGEEVVYIDDYSVEALTNPTITITSPDGSEDLQTGNFNLEFEVQNFTIGTDGSVVYSVDGTEMDHFSADPIAISDLADGMHLLSVNLKDNDGTVLFGDAGDTVSINIVTPMFTQVATIADLRASAEGEIYQLTGEAFLTYQQSFRNQKFVQDATGGILIDDTDGQLSTAYEVNDGITGITGELTSFGGMLQFVPIGSAGPATSTGNTITPTVVTTAELTNNFEAYESELVTIMDVSFADAGAAFENAAVYVMTDAAGTYNFRATFFNVNYIGSIIPEMSTITGIPNSRNDGEYFTSRNIEDIQGVMPPLFTEVDNIAELRAGVEGELYRLTGEAILTYQQTFRNQKYVQDATGGILIDDNDGNLSTTYSVNDGITNITGTLASFGGMLQLVPSESAGAATSMGNTIPTQVISLSDLINNFEDYEAEVVTINDLTFADAGAPFENGNVYAISDPADDYNFRTTFFNVDYIGSSIPTGMINVTGIPNSRDLDGIIVGYLTARNLADFDGVPPPSITDVANIAELRAGIEGELYRLTGEAVLTYQQSFRNQKYIQDATAGVLIDDSPGTLSTTYNVNDGITGLVGRLGSFGGMTQFAPFEDAGPATSSNNSIPEQIITFDDLVNNFEDHEGEVMTILEVGFAQAGSLFENGTIYGVFDPSASYNFRTTFFDVDYIGGPIPDFANVRGIPNSRTDGDYFTARNLADIDVIVSTEDLTQTNFSIFPNPNNGIFSIVNEGVTGMYTFEFMDLLGQTIGSTQVQLVNGQRTEVVSEIQTPGMYFVKMSNSANNFIRTLPLIVE